MNPHSVRSIARVIAGWRGRSFKAEVCLQLWVKGAWWRLDNNMSSPVMCPSISHSPFFRPVINLLSHYQIYSQAVLSVDNSVLLHSQLRLALSRD